MPLALHWLLGTPGPAAQHSPSISYNAAAYLRQLKLMLPPGDAFKLEPDSKVTKTLDAIAQELGRVDARGVDMIEESDPRTADETIEQWEEMLSLPDERVLVIPATLAERRIAVTSKYVDRGGQNTAYFIALAAACGYTIVDVDLVTPTAAIGITSTSGGSLAPGTYGYKVSAVSPYGETLASAEVQATIGGAGAGRIQVTWGLIDGATSYRVFGRSAGAGWLCIAGVDGATSAFMDDGSVTPGDVLPAGPNPLAYKGVELHTELVLRMGDRVDDRFYGAEYAYAMLLNVQTPAGDAMAEADFERVIRHVTHAHIQVIFTYHP